MKIKTINISPEMATQWLEKNNSNRSVSLVVVKKYARDMQAGRWKLTHQGIAFYKNGSLADGQHRLKAIIESGCTITMMVASDIDDDSSIAIDQLRARSNIDQIKIAGNEWVRADYIAAIRCLVDVSKKYKNLSSSELLIIANQLRPSLEFVNSNLMKKQYISSAPVQAAIVLAHFNNENENRLIFFCHVLNTGLIESNDDKAAILIRDFLSSNHQINRGGKSREIVCLKTQRAIKAFCDKEQISNLICPKSTIYPVPDFI